MEHLRTYVCYFCRKGIKNRRVFIKHVNIVHEPHMKRFCSKQCKDDYITALRLENRLNKHKWRKR